MNINQDEILNKIKSVGENVYLVGGYIRDLLMTKTTPDRDIVVKKAGTFAEKLSQIFEGTLIILDEENQIFRVVLKDKINFIDISEMVGNTIEEDLLRRDFTINSIAYDLNEDKFIDVTGGIDDIKNRIIRGNREENITDDPLRIIRAFRFKAVTGFSFDANLVNWIKKYKNLVLNPSKERINYELMKLMGGEYAADTLEYMEDFELLSDILPLLKDVKKVTSNSHHHLDLFHHSTETVRQIELQYKNANETERSHLDSIDFGGFARINHLKLAALLHDTGKFSTWTIDENSDRHRFVKHEEVGSKLCVPMLRGLKFSKKQIEYITAMVKYHIYPSSVVASEDLNEKIMMRYLRKMNDNVIDNIFLARADRLSARGPAITEELVSKNLSGLGKLLNFYIEKKDTLKPLPKLLDGNEIMKLKNMQPSKELGEIKNKLYEAQLDGDILTKEDAINFVMHL